MTRPDPLAVRCVRCSAPMLRHCRELAGWEGSGSERHPIYTIVNPHPERVEAAGAASAPRQMALLPCPFCGSDAEQMPGDYVDEAPHQSVRIVCTDCEAMVEGLNQESARIRWNARIEAKKAREGE